MISKRSIREQSLLCNSRNDRSMHKAKALVIDDKPDEALPVIHALSMLGIPAIYSDGTIEDVESLYDIRIIFIDMVLSKLGADANDPVGCANMVSDTICRLVDPGNCPIAVIGWTGQRSIIEEFENEFNRIFPFLHDQRMSTLEKPSQDIFEMYFEDPGSLDGRINEIREEIKNRYREFGVLSTLYYWEQVVHDSATYVIRMISDFISLLHSDQQTWNDSAVILLSKLANTGGLRLNSLPPKFTLTALLNVLQPVLIDAVDKHQVEHNPDLELVAEQLKAKTAEDTEVSDDIIAKINTRLHLADQCDSPVPAPGYMYLLSDDSTNKRKFKYVGITNGLLINLCTRMSFEKPPKPNHIKDIEEVCIPFAMEISASCDYSQEKQEVYRFILGCLLYEDNNNGAYKPKKRAPFIEQLGPYSVRNTLSDSEAKCSLIFNAKYIVGVPCHRMGELEPFIRLRENVVSKITNWQTSYNSRIGIITL